MSVYRHPDPVIESWLADGPSMLSLPAREGVSRAVRATRQRRIVVLWLPDMRAGRLLTAGQARDYGLIDSLADRAARPPSGDGAGSSAGDSAATEDIPPTRLEP